MSKPAKKTDDLLVFDVGDDFKKVSAEDEKKIVASFEKINQNMEKKLTETSARKRTRLQQTAELSLQYFLS